MKSKRTKSISKKKKIFLIILSVLILALTLIGLNVLRIYLDFKHQVKSYSEYWNSRAQQSGEFIYVALGDSAAQGIGASKPTNGYVGIIANRIAEVTHKQVKVINLSLSGGESEDVLNRQIPLIRPYHPDLVTLAIGSNDVNNGISREQFTKQFTEILTQLPPKTFVADIPYFERGKKEELASYSTTLIHELAQKYNLIPVELHAATKVKFEDWDQYAADLFHPSDKGYHVWADAFWTKIEPTLK